MKNNDIYLNQGISWNEFEVVARNCPHAVRFENRTQSNKMLDFQVHVRHNDQCVRIGYRAGIGLHVYGGRYGTYG